MKKKTTEIMFLCLLGLTFLSCLVNSIIFINENPEWDSEIFPIMWIWVLWFISSIGTLLFGKYIEKRPHNFTSAEPTSSKDEAT